MKGITPRKRGDRLLRLEKEQRRTRRWPCDLRRRQRRHQLRELSGRLPQLRFGHLVRPDYLPAYYTNYGPGCNVAAPGGDASISPAGTSAAQVLSTLPSELPAELGTDGADYGYAGHLDGLPHVSGVAALGLSPTRWPRQALPVDEFKSMLLTAVNDIDSYIIGGTKNGMVLRNYRKNMGTGSIDAYQLLMQIEGTPCLPAKVGVQRCSRSTSSSGRLRRT
ncbi:MAG: hypothetical protein ACLRMJ_04965 [Alistipes finegoldii]